LDTYHPSTGTMFCSCSVDLPRLPCFPPRRSSDLVCRLVAAAMQPATLAQPVFARLANATWSFSQRYWRLVVVAMLLLLHIAVFRDRKSTRLNSSHVAISYAVFCLKKKKR